MPGKIVERNRIPEVLKVIEELNDTVVQVGIFAPEGSELFMIAMVNEYGTNIQVTPKMRAYLHRVGLHLKATTNQIKIPERSFIRAGYDSIKGQLESFIERALPLVISLKMPVEQFFSLLGEQAVGAIHEYISAGVPPPNHPFTVRGKKSSKPLIDTGRLNQSITYRVVKK